MKIRSALKKTVAITGIIVLAVLFAAMLWTLLRNASNDARLVVAYLSILLTALLFMYSVFRFKLDDRIIYPAVFLLAFLFQSVFSLNVELMGEGDLQFYFNNAMKMAENSFSLPSLYCATFPGTVTYPAVLAMLMKLFGAHRMVPVILNQIVASITIAAVYSLMKRKLSRLWALGCAMLMAVHPYLIIYSNTCNAEILYGCFILLSFIAFDKALSESSSKRYLWILLSAVLCGVSVFFRPLWIILVAAYLIYLFLFESGEMRCKLVYSLMLCFVTVLFTLASNATVKSITSFDAPSHSYGWNLYVGGSEYGTWNESDAAEFNEVITAATTPSEVQSHFAKKAFERYKDMGAGIIPHALRKIKGWYSIEYMAGEAVMQGSATRFNTQQSGGVYLVLSALLDIPIFALAIAACILIFAESITQDGKTMTVLALYIVGSVLALILLETAPRYTVSHHITFCILAVYAANRAWETLLKTL